MFLSSHIAINTLIQCLSHNTSSSSSACSILLPVAPNIKDAGVALIVNGCVTKILVITKRMAECIHMCKWRYIARFVFTLGYVHVSNGDSNIGNMRM